MNAATSAGGSATRTQPLRNSCEPCHLSKLRCSREKPVCARCAKNGSNCTYAPTKRPGRPRKVPPAATTAGGTRTIPSREDTCANANTQRRRRQELLNTVLSGHSDASRDALLLGPVSEMLDLGMATTNSHDLGIDVSMTAPVTSVGLDRSPGAFDFINTYMLSDADILVDPLAKSLDTATTTGLLDYEDPWWLTDPLTNLDVTATASFQSQNTDQSPSLEQPLWPTDPTMFTEDCSSLKQWMATSQVLGAIMVAPEESAATEHDCLCRPVAANLFFHIRSGKNVAPHTAVEACLHLQRILDWAWSTLKGCHSCWDHELIPFMVAGAAKEVVTIYSTIVEDVTRRSRSGSIKSTVTALGDQRRTGLNNSRTQPNQNQTQTQTPSPLEATNLSFGKKTIHEPIKTAFLRRLITLKLRHLGSHLSELLRCTQVETVSGLTASPLWLHITGIQERINITAGMLSTLD